MRVMSSNVLPMVSWGPPVKNSPDSSRNVIASRLEVTCSRFIACCQTYLADPVNITSDRRGRKTRTSVSLSLNVRCVECRRLSVTSRSPQSQVSSRWRSMAEPRSGVYSRWHNSTATKSRKESTDWNLSTTRRLNWGKPEKLPMLTFFFLKFTFGPKSFAHKNQQQKFPQTQNTVSNYLLQSCAKFTACHINNFS